MTSDAQVQETANSPRAASPAALASSALARIPVLVQVVLGGAKMAIADVSALSPGEIVRLDRRIGDPVDILVNGRLFGRADIAVLEGDEPRFAISVTEIVDGASETAI